MEMTGRGRRGKPTPGFPPRPPPLEIAARFPHSHSRDDSGKVESQRQASHFPTAVPVPLPNLKRKNKGGLAAGAMLHLQAHSSIRKCSGENAELRSGNSRCLLTSTQNGSIFEARMDPLDGP